MSELTKLHEALVDLKAATVTALLAVDKHDDHWVNEALKHARTLTIPPLTEVSIPISELQAIAKTHPDLASKIEGWINEQRTSEIRGGT